MIRIHYCKVVEDVMVYVAGAVTVYVADTVVDVVYVDVVVNVEEMELVLVLGNVVELVEHGHCRG